MGFQRLRPKHDALRTLISNSRVDSRKQVFVCIFYLMSHLPVTNGRDRLNSCGLPCSISEKDTALETWTQMEDGEVQSYIRVLGYIKWLFFHIREKKINKTVYLSPRQQETKKVWDRSFPITLYVFVFVFCYYFISSFIAHKGVSLYPK